MQVSIKELKELFVENPKLPLFVKLRAYNYLCQMKFGLMAEDDVEVCPQVDDSKIQEFVPSSILERLHLAHGASNLIHFQAFVDLAQDWADETEREIIFWLSEGCGSANNTLFFKPKK